ncbi:uncharacterized protein MELLADRAFT_89001 [Melampsora larici-populina 98AG31]|uniref:Secreted protein n=1 Tax=Melampsora larici-populina (strain 98AG31 / pathotype 3-4-7) TaxID=747676 RepID=F4R6L4_MELLP|nr:uncharacterized protein MELLADRAFT_89001 [Melampsora larici-populina 98AG31]EGG12443.1 hypothetical protein MELLADRAFT_89001 [Melampsora larici-populina 98AG31]
MASLILSAIWIRKGVAAQFPQRYNLNEQEMEQVNQMAGDRLEQVSQELSQAQFEEEKVDVDEIIGGESNDKDNKKEEGEDADKDWTDQ